MKLTVKIYLGFWTIVAYVEMGIDLLVLYIEHGIDLLIAKRLEKIKKESKEFVEFQVRLLTEAEQFKTPVTPKQTATVERNKQVLIQREQAIAVITEYLKRPVRGSNK